VEEEKDAKKAEKKALPEKESQELKALKFAKKTDARKV